MAKETLTWQQMHEIYKEGISHLKPNSQAYHEKGWNKLMEILPEFYPDAVDDVMVFINLGSREAVGRLMDNDKQGGYPLKAPRNCWMAIRRIFMVAENGLVLAHVVEDLDAHVHNFGKKEANRCMEQWLLKEGWQDIERAFYSGSRIDLRAKKNGKTFVGMSLPGIWKKVPGYVRVYNEKTGRPYYEQKKEMQENMVSFRDRIGRIMLALIEEVNENNSCIAAMLVADDPGSRKALQPYVKHIKRLRIHIYMVRSVSMVEEL